MKKFILILIFILGSLLHIWFFGINEVLKNADNFAYLQMSYYIQNLDVRGFGTGWFGFLYSFGLAVFDIFIKDEIIASYAFNIFCLNIIGILTYFIGRKLLSFGYNILVLILLFLSPILLNFNIGILSENIYIPLFLVLFLGILNFRNIPNSSSTIFLSFIIALMYLTRSEAFIYIGSIGLVFLYLLVSKKIKFVRFLGLGILGIVSFFVFISPFLYHLYTITGEVGLTNKGSANLRQAELRGVDKMDDDGFEKAVGELTPDKKHLMAGFAGGLKYDKPFEDLSLGNFLLEDTNKTFSRILDNQQKLYTKNLPRIIGGGAIDLYEVEGSSLFYKNIIFYIGCLIPSLLFLYGLFSLFRNKKYYFAYSFLSFFIIGSIFFTLFFVLDRYFIVFLPIFLVIMIYGLENIDLKNKYLNYFVFSCFSLGLIGVYSLGLLSYYNTNKDADEKYYVKEIAGDYLKEYHLNYTNLKILERFPIVTYYSGSRQRWITPYTDNLDDLLTYANYNNIDYLIVDSLDFKEYRQGLKFLLEEPKDYNGLELFKTFEYNGQKVIIYRIEK